MRRVAGASLAALAALTAPRLSSSQSFVVTDSAVRQGRFEARALSRDTIISSYPRAAREVRFRFSINGLENEFPSGTEHTIYLRPRGGRLVTAVYRFGVEDAGAPPTPEASASSEDGPARVTFRLDLREVLRVLRERGSYQPPLGASIARNGIAHVYVLGDPAPLSWSYADLRPGIPAELTDPDGDGVYEGTVVIETQYTRPRIADGRAIWARTADLSRYPALASSQPLQDAVYRLSLEELQQLVRDDGALSAGAKWPGVWTRDVSLAGLLSLAIVAPDAVRRSLLAKVDSTGRIIQDTGTGGSWPVSSDRMVWALAAMQVYEVTGDRAWLRRAYDITRRSAEADRHAVRDVVTGLANGESSFMDWREQSYPRWMQPADIYSSQSLSTNAIHYGAFRTLATMASDLGESATVWQRQAAGLRDAMSRELWQADRGYFAQFRYGRTFLSTSPRSESLGQALAIILGVASPGQARIIMRRAPVVEFGAPTFWPYIPGERFYHNATVWPFVTALWTWAAADAPNTAAVERGLDEATRSTALFLTNKENLVASTGHYEGTALNSDRQLWSVAGSLASTYRILFGFRLESERLAFRPMIPPSYGGERRVSGVRYRGATLDISLHGFGDGARLVRIDGRTVRSATVPAALQGVHTIDIVMNGRWPRSTVNEVPSRFALSTPVMRVLGVVPPPPEPRRMLTDAPHRARVARVRLAWAAVPGAVRYHVYRNGRPIARTSDTLFVAVKADAMQEYQVLATGADGGDSFLSEPVRVSPDYAELSGKPPRPFEVAGSGYTGQGYVRLLRRGPPVSLMVSPWGVGEFAVDVRYANGNGPVNTEDKVAVRTLVVDGVPRGMIVMPQRGAGQWSNWGWSNAVHMSLGPGTHTISLVWNPLDENMNGLTNTALLDLIRITSLSGLHAASDTIPHPLP